MQLERFTENLEKISAGISITEIQTAKNRMLDNRVLKTPKAISTVELQPPSWTPSLLILPTTTSTVTRNSS